MNEFSEFRFQERRNGHARWVQLAPLRFAGVSFAPVWDEKNGTPLSILSALARLGMDPWGEAARLAEMPRAAAVSALAAILARLPRSEPEVPDYSGISETSCAVPAARRFQTFIQYLRDGQRQRGRQWHCRRFSPQTIGLVAVAAVVAVVLQVNGWLF